MTRNLSALQSHLIYIYNPIKQLIDKALNTDATHLQNRISFFAGSAVRIQLSDGGRSNFTQEPQSRM